MTSQKEEMVMEENTIIQQIVDYLDIATTAHEPGKWAFAKDLSQVLKGVNVDRGVFTDGVPGFYFVSTRTFVLRPSSDKNLTDEERKAADRASMIPSDFWLDCAVVYDESMSGTQLCDTPYTFGIGREDAVNGKTGHNGEAMSLMTTLSCTVIPVEEFAETVNARAVRRGEDPPITIPGHTGEFKDHSVIPPWTLRGDTKSYQWRDRGEELPSTARHLRYKKK
jgi:hypothetical protein